MPGTLPHAIEEIQSVVAADCGCSVTHDYTCWVCERAGSESWEGEIEVFALRGHATASRCYAWRGDDGEVTTLLQTGPALTPRTAVRLALQARAHAGTPAYR